MNTQQQFPKEQTDLLQAVYDMRKAQQDYFNQPTKYRLQVAKVREQKVDVMLQPYVKAGAIKPTAPPSNTTPQKDLFANG